jgi:RNA polymerase sigma-70 factor (ECF subfamily)
MPTCEPGAPDPPTSVRVRDAIAGDRESLGWIVTRFSPLLRAQASWRLGPDLRDKVEVDDIVAEAWLVILRKRADLALDSRRATPRLVNFLGATILNLVNRRIEAAARQRRRLGPLPASPDSAADPMDELEATVTGAVTNAARNELGVALEACLTALPEKDREVILLRIVEGLSNLEAAEALEESPNTVSHRYRRALQKLREIVPDSLLDDFPAE